MSPNWQDMIDFLYKKEVIQKPEILWYPFVPGTPELFIAAVIPKYPAHMQELYAQREILGSGASFDYEESIAKGIGEFLERYFLLPFNASITRKASAAELLRSRETFLHPSELAVFSKEQEKAHKEFQFSSDTQFSWVNGRNLSSGKDTLLPAQLVFLRYNAPKHNEPILREENSNGAAGGFTLEKAILHGVKELIERDAFLIWWLNTLTPPQIDITTINDEEILSLLRIIREYHLDIKLLNLTLDLDIPIFASVLIDCGNGGPSIFLGAGCDYNPQQAIKSAIIESLMIHRGHKARPRSFSLPDPYTPFEAGNWSLEQRIQLWASPSMVQHFSWFLGGKKCAFQNIRKTISAPIHPQEELDIILQQLHSLGKGYEIYYYAVENEILDQLNYTVIKTIIPGFTPLYLREAFAPLRAPRLREIPSRFGYRSKFPNPLPHPFP